MKAGTRTRREVADELGLTYSTLRVYERHLGELLELSQGPNRTTLYPEGAVRLLAEAIHRKREGLPFSKLKDYFRGRLAPPRAAEGADPETLAGIRSHTQEILSIGQRIEEKLLRMEEHYQSFLEARRAGGKWTQGGGGHE